MDSSFDIYLKERYTYQVSWYDNKAVKYKRLYYLFQWLIIIISATLPVLISITSMANKNPVIILSVVLSILTTSMKAFKFQENWINYRTITEILKKEKYFFESGIDCYQDESIRNNIFIERVEAVISKENNLWIYTHIDNNEKNTDKK